MIVPYFKTFELSATMTVKPRISTIAPFFPWMKFLAFSFKGIQQKYISPSTSPQFRPAHYCLMEEPYKV